MLGYTRSVIAGGGAPGASPGRERLALAGLGAAGLAGVVFRLLDRRIQGAGENELQLLLLLLQVSFQRMLILLAPLFFSLPLLRPQNTRIFACVIPRWFCLCRCSADYGSAPDVEVEAVSPLGFVLGKKKAVRRVSARDHDLACLRSAAMYARANTFYMYYVIL